MIVGKKLHNMYCNKLFLLKNPFFPTIAQWSLDVRNLHGLFFHLVYPLIERHYRVDRYVKKNSAK